MWLINGTPADTVHASDRGLHFGDGLFETMALTEGRVRFLDYHLDRLAEGCERLAIAAPDNGLLQDEIDQICRGHERAVVKLIVTRGRGGRGYAMTDDAGATRILSIHPWPDVPPGYYRDGVSVRLCDTPVSSNRSLAGLKHLNRLEHVLARLEWTDETVVEGLMLDDRGCVVEGTCTNVFLVTGPELATPALSLGGVSGVMRRVVLDSARKIGKTVVERDVFRDELEQLEELFLTNSIIGIWPVTRLEHRRLVIGPTTRMLMLELAANGVLECAA